MPPRVVQQMRPATQNQGKDPRLSKEILGWNMTPELVMISSAVFIIVVVVLHFTGSMFRSA